MAEVVKQEIGQNLQTANRLPLSAFVICYNEEDQIADCLKSLSFCDEIVVIDSFSTDRTVEIAISHGAKVIQRKWPGYREQKAFGLTSVAHEWIVNLDADERISDELRDSILTVLKQKYLSERFKEKDPVVGYSISRVVYYLGRWWRKGGWYPEYRVRFFSKSNVKWGGVDPHEKPIVDGKIEKLEGEILHYTYQSMDEQFQRLHNYSTISAKEDYAMGKRPTLSAIVISPVLRTFKFYFLKRGYREGIAGLIVAIIEGYYTFMKYAKLWEYHFNNKEK